MGIKDGLGAKDCVGRRCSDCAYVREGDFTSCHLLVRDAQLIDSIFSHIRV